MERDSSSRSLVLHQNFYKVHQREFRDLLEFPDLFFGKKHWNKYCDLHYSCSCKRLNGTVTVILPALADGLYSLTSGIETTTVNLTALADDPRVSQRTKSGSFSRKRTVALQRTKLSSFSRNRTVSLLPFRGQAFLQLNSKFDIQDQFATNLRGNLTSRRSSTRPTLSVVLLIAI
jgi:hypothetical protein